MPPQHPHPSPHQQAHPSIPPALVQVAAAVARAVADARDPAALEPWHDDRFGELALAVYAQQQRHVPAYREWCEATGEADPKHWRDIPALPIAAFKRMRVAAHPPGSDAAVWHSSTTTGATPSRHFLPDTGLYELSLLAAADAALTPERTAGAELRAIQLVPGGDHDAHSSLGHMLDLVGTRLCSSRVVCASEHGIDAPAAWRELAEAAAHGIPVLLLASSFALVHLLDHGAGDVRLAAGSRLMDTGGYKGRSREVSRHELMATACRRLGVLPSLCENEYGMSELSSQAYVGTIASALGRPLSMGAGAGTGRWQPPWFRTRVVDPTTLVEVGDGERGLLVHHDLANAWTCAAIRTDDVGIRRGDGFELLGRAPGSELRGCSLRLEDVFGPLA